MARAPDAYVCMCAFVCWGSVTQQSASVWFPAPGFTCWLEYKNPACMPVEEVWNATSGCGGAAGATEILCPPSQGSAFTGKDTKSSCHELRDGSKAGSWFEQPNMSAPVLPTYEVVLEHTECSHMERWGKISLKWSLQTEQHFVSWMPLQIMTVHCSRTFSSDLFYFITWALQYAHWLCTNSAKKYWETVSRHS